MYKEVKKCNLYTPFNPNARPKILTDIESKNIELPSNQEKIKNHFLKIIAEELAMNDANGSVPPENQKKEEEKEKEAPIHQEKEDILRKLNQSSLRHNHQQVKV